MKNQNVIECQNLNISFDMGYRQSRSIKETTIGFFSKLRNKQNADLIQSRTKHALKNINLKIKKGECIALIGHNGCGKSTLLKAIAGILLPHTGSVVVNGRIAPLIELGAGFDPELTGRENVYLSCSLMGLTKREIDSKIESIKSFAELGYFFDAPVKTYSSGMYMRLGFSCTTVIDADILLIDEILSVGDENFQKKCFHRMKQIQEKNATIVIVSHDLNTIKQMANRIVVIDNGSIVFNGAPIEAIDHYQALMAEKRLKESPEIIRDENIRKELLEKNDSAREYGIIAKVESASISLSGGLEVQSNMPWSLKIKLRLHQKLEQTPRVGFQISTMEGLRIFGGNSHQMNAFSKESSCPPGLYEIVFNLEGVPLASGKYTLAVAIHNNDLTKTLDLVGDALNFEVMNPLDELNFDNDIINPLPYLKTSEAKKVSDDLNL